MDLFSKYNKDNTYLMACSGGPDSMALLDMLYRNNFKIIVCHVNYKTRLESDSEQNLVEKYCHDRNILCFVSIYSNQKGNFEDKAREFRYSFFEKVYKDNNASGLFVAHHKDDLIETYIFKKKRNVINESLIIKDVSIIKGMNVYRPLIHDFYKKDLLEYCINNNLPYGIDKTNFEAIHERNKIRISLLCKDKEAIYQEAMLAENNLINLRNKVINYIKSNVDYKLDDLKENDDAFLSIFLYETCNKEFKQFINKSTLLKLHDFIKSDKPNLVHNISGNYYLIKDYDKVYYSSIEAIEFSYKLDYFEFIETNEFKTLNNGIKMEGIYLSNEDFPIIIRNYHDEDKIALKEGYKKVSRLFVDKKIPLSKRSSWLVIENNNNEIIYVYKLYRKYGLKDIKNNMYFKLKY